MPTSPPVLVGENFIHEFFSYVNDCIEDMATFTVLAKILSANYSCNTEVYVAGLVKVFSHKIMVFLFDVGLNKRTYKVFKESTPLLCNTVAVKRSEHLYTFIL